MEGRWNSLNWVGCVTCAIALYLFSSRRYAFVLDTCLPIFFAFLSSARTNHLALLRHSITLLASCRASCNSAFVFSQGSDRNFFHPSARRRITSDASAHHHGVRRRLLPFGMALVAALVIALTSVNFSSSTLWSSETGFLSSCVIASLYSSQFAFLRLHRGSFLWSMGGILMVMVQAWWSEKGFSAASQVEYGSHLLGTAATSIALCVPVEGSVRVGTPSTLNRTLSVSSRYVSNASPAGSALEGYHEPQMLLSAIITCSWGTVYTSLSIATLGRHRRLILSSALLLFLQKP